MKTISYKWPRGAKYGDYTIRCDICGVHWRRSVCRKDGSGWWRCPDDQDGLDPVTLDQMNSEHSQRRRDPVQDDEGGGAFDSGVQDTTYVTEVP